jgi:hypothetical protein
MKNLIIIFFLFLSYNVVAQSNPSGVPTQFSTGWFRHGWDQSDSGKIFTNRQPNFTPRFPGTVEFYQDAGVDSLLSLWTGGRWLKLIPGFDSTSISNRINLKLNISDTTGKWLAQSSRLVDTMYRVNDSTVGYTVKGSPYTFQILGRSQGATGSGLTSVGLSMPSAFSVSGSPLTSNGTINVSGAGTTLQYIRGNGTLATTDTGMIPNFYLKVRGLLTGTSPITFNQTTGAIGINNANTTGTKGAASFTSAFSDNGAGLIDLADLVATGSCTNCSITYNAKGQATAYSSGTGPTGVSVDTIFRTPGVDSIYYTINSVQRAILDSTGPATTANNGLTYASGNIQVGQTISAVGNPGSLLHNTEIPLNGFNTVFTGTGTVGIGLNNPSAFASLDVLSTGISNAVKATSASGAAVNAFSTLGNGVVGVTGTNAIGVSATSNGGYGIVSNGGLNGIGGRFTLTQQGNSTDNLMLDLSLLPTGTGITSGAGYTIALRTGLSDGTANTITGKIKHFLSNALPGAYSSELEFHLVNNTVLARKALLSHTGQWTWDGYPALTAQVDTTTYKPIAIDASGNIVKMIGWAGGGGGGSFAINNIGSGYRFAATPTGNIKTAFVKFGTRIDSTSNSNGITFSADTSVLATRIISSNGCILGNSTIADYIGYHGIYYYLMTTADSVAGTTITSDAVPGNTIDQQRLAWQADANKATYDWIVIEVGLNDLDPTEAAAIALGRYQRLVDTVVSQKKQGARILLSTMTPCKQRLIDLYGSTNGLIAYQKWLDMNAAIMGALPNRIVGADYRITNHTIALNDGQGNLLPAYNIGDGVHENDAARAIIASFWRNALNEIGYLKVTQPEYFNQAPFYQTGDSIYALNTLSSLFLGRTVNGTVSRPIALNTGGSVGASAGNPWNCKLITFDGGFGDSTLISGIGVSSGRQEYHVLAGGVHSFYIAGISATVNEKMQISETASGEGKLTLRAIAGGYSTATPSVIDMGGSVSNTFGDPTKCKLFLFNNAGVYAGIGDAFDGTSMQFELHSPSNSSFHAYINSIDKFAISDTSLVAPGLQTTTDTTTFKPVVQNSSGYIKRMTSWPTGAAGGTTLYSGDGALAGNRTVTGNNLSLTLDTIFNFRVNANTFILAQKDRGFPYTASVVAVDPHNYQFGYTPTPTVYTKGAGIYIDTNNNIGLAISIPTTLPMYSTGNSAYVTRFQSGGSNFYKSTTITSNVTANTDNYIYLIDATSGNVTVTLPAASASYGGTVGINYKFKRMDNSGNTVTIQRAGSDTIDGNTSFTLTTQYEVKEILAISTSSWGVF